MQRKMYRIEQTQYHGIANDISLMAAISNGGKNYLPLQYMADHVKQEKFKYPSLSAGIEVTISENTLLLDQTTGDKTINLLAITEVEALQLIDEEAPTLNRYAGTGIADDNNHELIN